MKKVTITGYLLNPERTPEGNLKRVKKSITVRTKIGFMIAITYLRFFYDYIAINPLSGVRDILKRGK